MEELKGWHSRWYLPHFDGGAIPQFITFRLADSFPTAMLEVWKDELQLLIPEQQHTERIRRIEEYLDLGHGEAWLGNHQLADLVQSSIFYFDNVRYYLHSWVIMPNHVHTLFTPFDECSLSNILKSLKKYTAQEANIILNRHGQFWQEDYFDRFMRSEEHFAYIVAYIENNPVKAGLCEHPEDWPWSSAAFRTYGARTSESARN